MLKMRSQYFIWTLIAILTTANIALRWAVVTAQRRNSDARLVVSQRIAELKIDLDEEKNRGRRLRERLRAAPEPIQDTSGRTIPLFAVPKKEVLFSIMSLESVPPYGGWVSKSIRKVLHLSPEEVDRLNSALAESVAELQLLELDNFEVVEVADGQVIRIAPFPVEGEKIGAALESKINDIIGPERGRVFFDLSHRFFQEFGRYQTDLSFVPHPSGSSLQYEVKVVNAAGTLVGGSKGGGFETDETNLRKKYPRYGHIFEELIKL